MNWQDPGSIAELISAMAVVVSLVYLACQIRQNTSPIDQKPRAPLMTTNGELLCMLVLSIAVSSCNAVGSAPPGSPAQGPVTARDFFYFSCVHQYMQRQSIPAFDGSLAYAVEYVDTDAAVLEQLYAAAKAVALAIPAPNYADPEHGAPAVLVRCQNASRSAEVERILRALSDQD